MPAPRCVSPARYAMSLAAVLLLPLNAGRSDGTRGLTAVAPRPPAHPLRRALARMSRAHFHAHPPRELKRPRPFCCYVPRSPHAARHKERNHQPVARDRVPVLARLQQSSALHGACPAGGPQAGRSDSRTGWSRRRRAKPWSGMPKSSRTARIEVIAWRSLDDSDIRHEGFVRFDRAPADRGTEVHVDLRYDAPAGQAGAAIAKLFGEEPAQQIGDDLRRFKQVMETGEVVRSDGSLEGAGQGPWQAARRTGAGCGGGAMKATCWMGKKTVEVAMFPIRRFSISSDAIVRITSTAICGSDLASLQRLHADDAEGRRARPRVHGRGGRGRSRREEPQGRRSRGRAVHDRVRQLLAVPRTRTGRCARTRIPTPRSPKR